MINDLDTIIEKLKSIREQVGHNIDLHFTVQQEAEFSHFNEERQLNEISVGVDMNKQFLEFTL